MVEDLGDRADGRARVAVHRLLVDRQGGREAVDPLDARLLHRAEELPRVGGQRLHEAALSLLVDRVEGERALAAPREPGHDRELVARDLHVDAFEIVLGGTLDVDRIHSSSPERGADILRRSPGNAVRVFR